MGVESATCLSPQGELSRVPPATEHRKGARRAPALEAPGPAPHAPRGATSKPTQTQTQTQKIRAQTAAPSRALSVQPCPDAP